MTNRIAINGITNPAHSLQGILPFARAAINTPEAVEQ
jgi:hypothetical protein